MVPAKRSRVRCSASLQLFCLQRMFILMLSICSKVTDHSQMVWKPCQLIWIFWPNTERSSKVPSKSATSSACDLPTFRCSCQLSDSRSHHAAEPDGSCLKVISCALNGSCSKGIHCALHGFCLKVSFYAWQVWGMC